MTDQSVTDLLDDALNRLDGVVEDVAHAVETLADVDAATSEAACACGPGCACNRCPAEQSLSDGGLERAERLMEGFDQAIESLVVIAKHGAYADALKACELLISAHAGLAAITC